MEERSKHIPIAAILTMSGLAICLILMGNLRVILEFGSFTCLMVSVLMAFANHKMRAQTKSSPVLKVVALTSLLMGGGLIIYYEATTRFEQLLFIVGIYRVLIIGAWLFSVHSNRHRSNSSGKV